MITWLGHSNWDWLKVNRTNQFVFLWWDSTSASTGSHNYCKGNSYYNYLVINTSHLHSLSINHISSYMLTRDQILTQLHIQKNGPHIISLLPFTLIFSKRSYNNLYIILFWYILWLLFNIYSHYNSLLLVNLSQESGYIVYTFHIYFQFGRYGTIVMITGKKSLEILVENIISLLPFYS